MTRSILLLSTLAILAAPMSWAQDTAAPAADAPAATSPATPEAAQVPPNNVLDTGEPADSGATNAAQADQTYTKNKSGAWDVQCLKVEEGEEPCQMYQLLKDGKGSNVAEVSLFKVDGSSEVAAGATFVVPLETLLTQKLTIAVDTGPAKRYDFSFCTQVGCYARVGFTSAEMAAFKAGVAGKVTIVPALAPDQKVTLDMSLSGFTAAYDQITSIKQ
ncbi:hypothetical protein P775_15205 [Puniceibacterium antarcticum]|uniref:Invasion associated locus B family protein n=1 Tax=Puniceibacterium antarcticum TaxID=1206336 RepID=A0A2G8RD31_9RHOB|nr:invasion associated locus B family protein [Puniceibacterium antarcticum]PIL19485.1 hypothetical protein P775_15205 [Puniceibacterium antarcticum]